MAYTPRTSTFRLYAKVQPRPRTFTYSQPIKAKKVQCTHIQHGPWSKHSYIILCEFALSATFRNTNEAVRKIRRFSYRKQETLCATTAYVSFLIADKNSAACAAIILTCMICLAGRDGHCRGACSFKVLRLTQCGSAT